MTSPSENKQVVLLVDNDESALRLYSDMLSEYDFSVITANEGSRAFELFCEHCPRVVVTDAHMPGMDGEELFSKIIEVAPDTKVIFITGWVDIRVATRLVKTGAFDYLDKPLSLSRLVEVVRTAFDDYSENKVFTCCKTGNIAGLEAMVKEALSLKKQMRQFLSVMEKDTVLAEKVEQAIEQVESLCKSLDDARSLVVVADNKKRYGKAGKG